MNVGSALELEIETLVEARPVETVRLGAFDTRAEAFEDALIERTTEAIVLLRADGSVHSELYHAASNGGEPQRVDLLAAATRDTAKDLE